MLDSQAFGDKLMLSSYVVVKEHFWEWPKVWSVRWRAGLSISEECSDDDEVFLWVQSFVFANEPNIIWYVCRISGKLLYARFFLQQLEVAKRKDLLPEYQLG